MTGPGGGLRLESVTNRFGSLVAVRGLSLAVAPGEVYGLIRPQLGVSALVVG